MNRRKPKVVIPTNVNQLIATALRVVQALTSGVSIAGNRLAQQAGLLQVACDRARELNDERIRLREASQQSRSLRDDANTELYDVLAQARDFANATRQPGGSSGAGRIGFEVNESNGSVAVPIPQNPDQFMLLAQRVAGLISGDDDAVLVGLRDRMITLYESSVEHQTSFLMQRESSQRLISQRNDVSAQITNLLRQIRDVGFGIVGPYRYEELSTMGFVVQSTATQTNGTTETSEQNWSEGESHPEVEDESEETDSGSWNSAPFLTQSNINGEGGGVLVTPNPSWVPGDDIPDAVTEIEDLYRYTNTLPSDVSPFWTFGPHHDRYGQIPMNASAFIFAWETACQTEFVNTFEDGTHTVDVRSFSLSSVENFRLGCMLFWATVNSNFLGQRGYELRRDRLSLSNDTAFITCPHVCEGIDGQIVHSNNRWQPGDQIPDAIGGDSDIDCYTHTFSNIGTGDTETPLEYQRTHVQYPRKGVSKNLLRRYYDKALESACGSVALTDVNGNDLPQDDTSFVSVNCVLESFQRDVQFVNDGVADHEFSFDEIEYRSLLFLQEQINATNQVTGDIDDRLFRADVSQFISNLDDNFILNVLCVNVLVPQQDEEEIERELALSGCVEETDAGPLRLNPDCVCEQFGEGSRHCSLARENDRDGSGWPIDGSSFTNEDGGFSLPTLLDDGRMIAPTLSEGLPAPTSERFVEVLENLGNDNTTMGDLGLSEGEFVTEERFGQFVRTIPLAGPVTTEELQDAFDAIRNLPPVDGVISVAVETLGQITVAEGLAEDGDIFIENLGISSFEQVFLRTFIAYGGSESVWDLAVAPKVTVEQLIDEDESFSDPLLVDLELSSDSVVEREQLLTLGESIEKAWYLLSGADVPDNAFGNVLLSDFVASYDSIAAADVGDADGFELDQQVSRHRLIELDAEVGDENPVAVEDVFYSLF